MSEIVLLDDLADAVEAEMKDFNLKTKGGARRSPLVFRQYLPLPKSPKVTPRGQEKKEEPPGEYGPEDYEANFPCVVVKADGWNDAQEGAVADTRLLIGVYDPSPDAQGYRDVLNVMDHLRLYLLQNRTLCRRYQLKLPLKGGLYTEQYWPVFFGEISMSWLICQPAPQIKRKEGDWKNGTYPNKPEQR